MDKINCPFCGAPVTADFKFGKKYVCSSCGQTSKCRVDDDTAVKILVKVEVTQTSIVSIKANSVKIGGDNVAGDKITTNVTNNFGPPASGLVCPTCQMPLDADAKPGKRYICGICSEKSFVSADGLVVLTWAEAMALGFVPEAKMAATTGKDLGAKGEGVNIDAGDGDVNAGDVTGRFKIGDD